MWAPRADDLASQEWWHWREADSVPSRHNCYTKKIKVLFFPFFFSTSPFHFLRELMALFYGAAGPDLQSFILLVCSTRNILLSV